MREVHRTLFKAVLAYVALKWLVIIDESGSHIGMTRELGCASKGERVHGAIPRNSGTATPDDARG